MDRESGIGIELEDMMQNKNKLFRRQRKKVEKVAGSRSGNGGWNVSCC